jgi:hypothetical protein
MIEVSRTGDGDPMSFEVTVGDGGDQSRHQVTMSQDSFQSLTGGKGTPESAVEAAFRFLLDREPKEAILGRFDITVISKYFPNFESKFGDYFGG